MHLYWLLHEVTLLSDHCLGPPEPYQKLTGFSMKMRTFYPRHELTSAPFKTRDSSIVEGIVEPTLHFQHSETAALFGWRLLLWLEEGQRAEEVRLYSLENLLSSHPPLLRDTGFNIAFLSYFSIQWKSCHLYFLLPKTQFIPKVCSTRPKPAFGRQGLEWDRRVRIQFRRVHSGVDTLWENIYFWKKISLI